MAIDETVETQQRALEYQLVTHEKQYHELEKKLAETNEELTALREQKSKIKVDPRLLEEKTDRYIKQFQKINDEHNYLMRQKEQRIKTLNSIKKMDHFKHSAPENLIPKYLSDDDNESFDAEISAYEKEAKQRISEISTAQQSNTKKGFFNTVKYYWNKFVNYFKTKKKNRDVATIPENEQATQASSIKEKDKNAEVVTQSVLDNAYDLLENEMEEIKSKIKKIDERVLENKKIFLDLHSKVNEETYLDITPKLTETNNEDESIKINNEIPCAINIRPLENTISEKIIKKEEEIKLHKGNLAQTQNEIQRFEKEINAIRYSTTSADVKLSIINESHEPSENYKKILSVIKSSCDNEVEVLSNSNINSNVFFQSLSPRKDSTIKRSKKEMITNLKKWHDTKYSELALNYNKPKELKKTCENIKTELENILTTHQINDTKIERNIINRIVENLKDNGFVAKENHVDVLDEAPKSSSDFKR